MDGMLDAKTPLWPYGITAAFLAIPLVWILLILLLNLSQRLANWPDPESRTIVMYFTLVVSLIPLTLVLLDFASARRAVVDLKGFRIDFSKIDFNQPLVRRESFRLPDNIGVSGAIISDSSPMQIVTTLQQATVNEIVRLDLDTGRAWWATRLLALSAGAVRAGSPEALVFVGKKENLDGTFLGWATPNAVLGALLADKEEYRVAYNRAKAIAYQVMAFGDQTVVPQGLALHGEVFRYTSSEDYTKLGEAVFEQILMDQLAQKKWEPGNPSPKSLENPPDSLSLARFNELFEPYLYRDAIDLAWPNEQRLLTLLDSNTPYIALTRGGRYEAMLQREAVERVIIRELFSQYQQLR
ncbi:MAG: hypothetical protein ACRERE_26520 [Candidatus Entotheonellia bacterium]